MAYSDNNPYNQELDENKARYDRQEIDKDEYESRARTIRRKARQWERHQDDPLGTAAPKKTTKRSRKTKTPKTVQIDHTELKAELMQTFSGLEEHELALGESCHAITWPSIVQAKMADPEKDAGQAIVEKFRSRWLQDPEWWTVYQQGDIEVYALGPIVEVL